MKLRYFIFVVGILLAAQTSVFAQPTLDISVAAGKAVISGTAGGDAVTLRVSAEDEIIHLDMLDVEAGRYSKTITVSEELTGRDLMFYVTDGTGENISESYTVTKQDFGEEQEEAGDKVDSDYRGSGSGTGSGNGTGTGNGVGGYVAITPQGEEEHNNIVLEDKKADFDDVPQTHWGYDAISHLAGNGIISGYGDGTFKPEANITRAEFVKLLVVAFGMEEDAENSLAFADVRPTDWYYGYVYSAVKNNIAAGYDNGYFGANDLITRQDMVVMAMRAVSANVGNDTPAYSDSGEIDAYARAYVAKAQQEGIVSGVGNDLFAPKANASRAMAAGVIYNILYRG